MEEENMKTTTRTWKVSESKYQEEAKERGTRKTVMKDRKIIIEE